MYRGIFMATIKQIAEITNVSRGTIDRVLNNRGGVSPETEKKVRAAMEALNYLPNKAAQNLAVRRKKLKFGFILISPNNYNPFFAVVEKGIRKKALELEEFGVTVDIRFTPINEINKQLELLDDFVANEYNGIVIRPYKVTVEAFDRMGNPFTITEEDFMATVFSHEIDHLNGILFIDKAVELFAKNDAKAYDKFQKRQQELKEQIILSI